MKKVLSLFLALTFIVATMACFSFNADAASAQIVSEDRGIGSVIVSPLSYTSPNGTDWSVLWTKPQSQVDETINQQAFSVEGKFDTSIVVKTIRIGTLYGARVNGMEVYLSSDGGNTWTSEPVATVSTTVSGAWTDIDLTVTDTGVYNAIKFSVPEGKLNRLQFYFKAVFGVPQNLASKRITATSQVEGDVYANAWNNTYNTSLHNSNSQHETYGKLSVKTKLDRVVLFVNGGYSQRIRDAVIMATNTPEDDESWVKIAQLPNPIIAGGYSVNITDNTPYEYIKIVHGHQGEYFSLTRIEVYGSYDCLKDTLPITPVTQAAADLTNCWNIYNKTQYNYKESDTSNPNLVMMTGKLANPTVLNKFVVVTGANGGRVNQSVVEASKDGENWTVICKISDIATAALANNVITVDIESKEVWSYVRISRNAKYSPTYWSPTAFGFKGEEVCSCVGSQSKSYTHETKGDVYAVRFVSTIDDSLMDAQSVGFEITATYESGSQTFDKSTSIVYSKIMDNGTEREASYFTAGHEYIFAITVDQIQKDTYGDITFTVKPYIVTSAGEKVYSAEKTVTYNNGTVVE